MADRLSGLMPFAIALALGLLVGVERQRSQTHTDPKFLPGGIRTFPLVALLGCCAAWSAEHVHPLGLVAVATIVGALVVASYILTGLRGDHGMATALASVLTFIFGVMAYAKQPLVAAALAVTTTALLSLRRPLHELAKRIEEADLYAALKLAALTVVVLPVLPDTELGPKPYDIFNPFKIWLLVVMIAAIAFGGYVGSKLLGPGRGIVAIGALGGLASSTAVTLSLSGRSKEAPDSSRTFALGIAIAWAIMFGRVLFEVGVVAPSVAVRLAVPMGCSMVAAIAGAGVLYWHSRRADPPAISFTNPFSIFSAMRFGAIFAIAILVARFAQLTFQDAGVVAAAALTGAVDVDAVTLSISKLAVKGDVSHGTAVTAIMTAAASNTVSKAVLASAIGSRALAKALLPLVALTLAAGAAGVLLAR